MVEYEPLDVVVDARTALEDGAPVLHEECGGNMSYSGVWEWGDVDAAFAEADHVVKISELHFDRFNSTPLELDGALVEFNRGTGQWTLTTNNQFPGFAVIMMAPAMRVGTDKLRIVTQDIGGGFGNKITSHPQLVACCLLARKLNRPVQWTEWRTDFHQSMSHGNERWFLDTEVAVKADGTMLGFRTKAIDDAGAYLRYEPLGGVIWSQVAPGMYGWRNIRVEFTQAMTNKAPVSPNRGYSRMQHLWLTERIIDIVAHELGFDRVEMRKQNYVQPEDMPYETPNGCVYDSGDYPRALDMALELIGYDTIEERRDGGRLTREAARGGDRLDARLGDEQLRPVAAPQPRPAVLREQRGRDGRSSTSSARSSSRSGRPRRGRATRRRRRRSSRTSSAATSTSSTSGPGTTATGTRTPGSRGRTRASSR